MRDLIAIAKSQRSRLQFELTRYDHFIAIAEELASRAAAAQARKARARDSARRSESEAPHDQDKPRSRRMSRL